MLTALRWTGTSVTVGSSVAAITVRVIAGGAGAGCAVPEAGSAIAPSNSSPVVMNRMVASQVQRMVAAISRIIRLAIALFGYRTLPSLVLAFSKGGIGKLPPLRHWLGSWLLRLLS